VTVLAKSGLCTVHHGGANAANSSPLKICRNRSVHCFAFAICIFRAIQCLRRSRSRSASVHCVSTRTHKDRRCVTRHCRRLHRASANVKRGGGQHGFGSLLHRTSLLQHRSCEPCVENQETIMRMQSSPLWPCLTACTPSACPLGRAIDLVIIRFGARFTLYLAERLHTLMWSYTLWPVRSALELLCWPKCTGFRD